MSIINDSWMVAGMMFFQALFTCLNVGAQTERDALVQPSDSTVLPPPSDVKDSISVTYEFIYGNSSFDLNYSDNRRQYRRILEFLQTRNLSERMYVHLTASSSPEGLEDTNFRLSGHRAQNLQMFLKGEFPSFFNERTQWKLSFQGEAWDEVSDIVRRSDLPDKAEIIRIIKNVPVLERRGEQMVESRKNALKALRNGKVWKVLTVGVFPRLRRVRMDVVFRPGEDLAAHVGRRDSVGGGWGRPSPLDTAAIIALVQRVMARANYVKADTLERIATRLENRKVRKEPRLHKPFFAVKTNLLQDCVTALNVELEFPIKNRCSVLLEHTFPWWRTEMKGKYYAFEVLRSGLELRYWFGNRKRAPLLTGMFAGLYGNAVDFDLKWQNKGWRGKTFKDFGMSVGYSFRLGANWRLETSVGLGYFDSDYTEYDHRDDLKMLVFKKDDHFRWIGPTKFKCSISWLLPNYSRIKKGGQK